MSSTSNPLNHAPIPVDSIGPCVAKVTEMDVQSLLAGYRVNQPFCLKSCLSRAKQSSVTGPSMSLNMAMSRQTALKAVHTSFLLDIEKRKPLPTTTLDEIDYGYGPSEPDSLKDSRVERPDMKRRRYQRRNSKTPQMLMAMNASILNLDFLEELDKQESKSICKIESDDNETKKGKVRDSDLDDPLDGGLVIAEELVMQLQKRRKASFSDAIRNDWQKKYNQI